MKKILLLTTFAALTCSGFAQLAKGRQMIGGNFNYNYNSRSNRDTSGNRPQQTSKNTYFTGTLRYGYFITDQIVVGITGFYSQGAGNGQTLSIDQGQSYQSNFNQLTNAYSAGVFSRYYKMLGKSRFAVFGNLTATYGMGYTKNKNTYSQSSGSGSDEYIQSTSTYSLGFSPGITYFVNNRIGLETYFGNLGFNSQKYENSRNGKKMQEGTNSNINSNLNFSFSSLFVGLNFYFGGNTRAAANKTD